MAELLNMKNIKKSFSGVQVLHEINLVIEEWCKFFCKTGRSIWYSWSYGSRYKWGDISISQDTIGMGVQAVEVGLKAIKGEQVEKHIYTKFFPITKDNAADENNWGNKVK